MHLTKQLMEQNVSVFCFVHTEPKVMRKAVYRFPQRGRSNLNGPDWMGLTYLGNGSFFSK